MLTALRKRSGGIVVKSLLILLIISFGAWGIQDWLTPAMSGNVAVTVGDREISPYEIRRRVNQEISRLRPLLGDQFTQEQALSFGIVDGVVSEQVSAALIGQGAAQLGVTISDDLVSQDIRSQAGFKGLAGNFDRDRFNQVLASNGLTEGDFVQIVRRGLSEKQYSDSFRTGARAPKVMVDAIYSYRNEMRVAEVALIKNSAFADVGEPDAAQIAAFHKDNAKPFTAPAYRKLTVLQLDANDLVGEISVSEDDIVQAYDARADEFVTFEKRKIQQLIVNDEEKAKAAHQLLMEGRDFAIVAKEIAGLDESALDLGLITKDDLLPELAGPAFALMQGTVTVPVQSALGWHLLKAVEIQQGGTKTIDQVRDQLKKDIAKEKAVDSLYSLSNQLEDELGGGSNLEDAASNLNLKIVTIAAIDGSGRDAAGNPVTSIPVSRAFVQTAFTTEEGQESQLTESGPDGFFVVRVDGVTEPALRPLASVRDKVIEAWKADKRSVKSKELAEKIISELDAGGGMDAIAKTNSLSFAPSKSFARDDRGIQSGISAELVTKVFGLQPGKAAFGITGEGFHVAILTTVTAANPVANKKGIDQLRDELTDTLRNDVTIQLTEALREDISVDVNRAMVNQLFSGTPAR